MKHLNPMTHALPGKAEQWMDVVCALAVTVNSLLQFFGGESPFFMYVEDKCDIPQPNTNTSA